MSIFLTTFVSLSFILNFDVNENNIQGYFIFKGNDTFAHLFRENQSINLLLMFNKNYEFYQSNVTNSFIFEWDGFIINDEKMKLVDANTDDDLNQLLFDNYTFLSSFLLEESETLPLKDSIETFQELIIAVVLDIILIGMIFRSDSLRSDSLIRKLYNILKSIFDKETNVQDDYVSMHSVRV